MLRVSKVPTKVKKFEGGLIGGITAIVSHCRDSAEGVETKLEMLRMMSIEESRQSPWV
jgi:hypothetical protein